MLFFKIKSLRDRDRFNSDYLEYLPKRAPSQGFVGMRGKKGLRPIPEWPKGLVDLGYFLANENSGSVE